MQTPVSKCIELSQFSARMLSKFPERPVLIELSQRMKAAGEELNQAQMAYTDTLKAILPLRVDLRFIDRVSDRRIRQVQQKIEMHEGIRSGPIATLLFPDGSAPITRLVGASQVKAMIDFEGRLGAQLASWPAAAEELAAIKALREQYHTVVTERSTAQQNARNGGAQRNAVKQRYVTLYAEIAARVQAEFPRDKPMQDLFFDDVRSPSSTASADKNDDGPVPPEEEERDPSA